MQGRARYTNQHTTHKEGKRSFRSSPARIFKKVYGGYYEIIYMKS
jgi:hypothetical protein